MNTKPEAATPERGSSMGPVLHVVATLDRGGTETACFSLASALESQGVENSVAAIHHGDGEIAEAITTVGGTPKLLPPGRVSRTAAFTALCWRSKPDAVVFHFFTIDHALLTVAARLAGVKRIIAVAGNPAPRQLRSRLAYKFTVILALTRALGVHLVCASKWIEASLAKLGPLPRSTTVIHNGCSVGSIRERAESARAARMDSSLAITMVARLDPIKDHETLMRAFARLPSAILGRTVMLRIVGDGVLRQALEARAAELRIASRTVFLGSRQDVPEQLGASDLFVLSTTRDEGFGIALIEALAAGTPVIASDVPACREVLEEDLGTLVPPGDSAALSSAIARQITLSASMPDVAKIERLYGMATMTDKYRALLSGRPDLEESGDV